MATKKKALQAAAGAAGGEILYVDDVFSSYLYTGNGSTQTITNDIDLDGEGGLVWTKSRTGSMFSHYLFDTERGTNKVLSSDVTSGESTSANTLTAFNTDGFSLGSSAYTNQSSNDFTSWTFRKAPGFFDVVTYTGNGTAGREIAHNLGCDVGMIAIKKYDVSGTDWVVYHKSRGTSKELYLNEDWTETSYNALWNSTSPTSSVFTVSAHNTVNASGGSYVAYLFADGDDAAAQIFGTDEDQAIISCGSYTGNGNTGYDNGPEVDLGFEPQWLMVKAVDQTEWWAVLDNMRGLLADGMGGYLKANTWDSEGSVTSSYWATTPTGFKVRSTSNTAANASGSTYIYIAIRRPHKPAESGTEVFAIQDGRLGSTAPAYNSGFVTDMGWRRDKTGGYTYILSRLTSGKYMRSSATDAELTSSADQFDYMTGFYDASSANSDWIAWMFKRSPGFFDVVCYEGDVSTNQAVTHNLGVAPEMIIVKSRAATSNWQVYHSGIGETKHLFLNDSAAEDTTVNAWGNTAPTATDFTAGAWVNGNGDSFIAYLFASQDGISKVGSYTGDGTTDGSHVIDCGFTNGARFVLIKVASGASGKWHVYDTERGITVGTDGALFLDSTEAENTTFDGVDPASSGFAPKHGYTNYSGREYIYLAIA